MTNALGDATYRESVYQPHCERIRTAATRHRGYEVGTRGDGFFITFERAEDALAGAVAIQEALAKPAITVTDKNGKVWTARVRIGVHTAKRELITHEEGPRFDYAAADANFAARVQSLGVGGQIIVSNSAYEAAGPRERYRWREWPGRRIKSFDQPETVWELLWDGQSRGEPGARWLPDWYMGERNRYVPRPALEEAVFQNFGALQPDGSTPRLVTLHGEGGIGKTRLAIVCAVRSVGRFKDGVYFVRLEGMPRSREAVAEAVGVALDRTGEKARPERLIADLRDKELLLLLDNYEAVDDTEVARFLAELLTGTCALRLLVTGREAVKLSDLEQVLPVEGMAEREASELFIARAGLKRKGWSPGADDQKALQRVLQLTMRIPLAVELAAAWVDKRTLTEIADGIEATPLGPLTGEPARSGRSAQADRHRSLTRCLDWSYRMLERPTQAGFACLGLFADSFSPEAASAVCGSATPPTLPARLTALFVPRRRAGRGRADPYALLDRLQDAALIRRIEVAGRSRYTLHRFTRAYAADRLTNLRAAAAARQRYVAYFRQLVAENCAVNDLAKLAILDAEWRNGAAAAEVAEGVKDFESVGVLSEQLGPFLALRRLWLEEGQLHERALAAARAAGDRPAEGRALTNQGTVYHAQGRQAEAESVFRQAQAIFKERGDRFCEGQALNNLGMVHHAERRWAEAESAYQQARKIFQESGDRLEEAKPLLNLGGVYSAQGQWAAAENVCLQAREIFRDCGDRVSEVSALYNLARVYERQVRLQDALGAYLKCLQISRESGNRPVEAQALEQLALWWQSLGLKPEALQYQREAVRVRESIGDEIGTKVAPKLLDEWERQGRR
jgi:predicted ATPase/class 3 adenylate cyclase